MYAFLSRFNLNTYIVIFFFQVFGIPRDCCKFKTKMSSRNALNPIWEETFELDIHLPDLAFIRFNVVDVTSNLTTAQRVVPVNRLRYNINFKNYSKSILKQYKIQICPNSQSILNIS